MTTTERVPNRGMNSASIPDLTESQVSSFRDQGFLAIDAITDAEEVAWMRRLYDRMFEERIGHAQGDHFDLAAPDEEGKAPVLAQILGPSRFFPEIRETQMWRNAERMIRQLLGPDAALNGDHAINKPPGGAATPWHQDEAYWAPDMVHQSVSVWIPLQAATVRNGCMHFVPGSHRLEIVPHQSIGNDERVHGLELCPGAADVSSAVACELPAGGATFHGGRTLHYAPPNHSDQPRRALILMGGLRPQPRSEPRRFPWLERKCTARAERAAAARPR